MRLFRSLVNFCAVLLAATLAAQARDLRDMSEAEITALQQRLSDGGCYQGAIDGQASSSLEAAIKACPSQDPILRIETGMHTGVIQRIGVDRQCRLLATGSWDKTVRLWSLPEGRLLRTLRWPIGPGDDGKVYAVAVSPDGRLVAAGGYDARWTSQQRHSVYLFDTASGALKARVGNFEDVIHHLAFSPNGRFLAAMLHAGNGLRVIDTERLSEVAADRDYGDVSYGIDRGNDLVTVAWSSDGRQLVAGGTYQKQGSDGVWKHPVVRWDRGVDVAQQGGKLNRGDPVSLE
jgi:WD40 repeat protein